MNFHQLSTFPTLYFNIISHISQGPEANSTYHAIHNGLEVAHAEDGLTEVVTDGAAHIQVHLGARIHEVGACTVHVGTAQLETRRVRGRERGVIFIFSTLLKKIA